MHDPSIRNPAYQTLTDQQLSALDALCDRFDRELVDGDGPRIETFLAEAPKAAQEGLLAELLVMELEYRTQQGEEPQQDDYVQHFPEQEDLIESVFQRNLVTQFPGHESQTDSEEAPPRLANFRLIKEIGRGGMGVVWLAEQIEPVKRRVALKLIKTEWNSKNVLARFEAEKQALALMDHQNIARVLDAGTTDDDRPYFVMELVDGIPITRYCDENKLSVDDRLKLFVLVCKAVQHAHQKGIIHRDLKPSNVLVTVIDGEAVPKIIDFGLAKAVEQNLQLSDCTMQTEFGKVVGTVQYMSPEQAELRGDETRNIDTRTDVYSLGVMLYELLTGSTPLDQETLGHNALLKVLELIREADPPRPSNRLSSSSNEMNSTVGELRKMHPNRLQHLLRGELDWVVMKSLEKDSSRRYQTANDLAQDLTNYLTGETVSARPPSTWYQLKKFARRHRGLVAAVMTIGLVLVAGIAGTTYGLIEANRKTKLAEDKTGEANENREKAKASEQVALEEKAKAESNEQRAIVAESLAEAEARRARDSEAAAQFQLANARWETGRAGDARQLLQEIPAAYRDNFEWNFCNRRFQGSDITCYGHSHRANCVDYSPDGKRIVSGGTDNKVRIWDATTGAELAALAGHTEAIVSIAFSPDGAKIASGSDDTTIRIWDARSGEQLQLFDAHTGPVWDVAFQPNGSLLASGSGDHLVRLWDLQSGWQGYLTKHREGVARVSFSPDGRRLLSSALDEKLVMWDVSDIHAVHDILTFAPGDNAFGIDFSPDGTRIAAGGSEVITIFAADSGQRITRIPAHATWINSVRFSPDGTRLASCGDDKVIRLWDVSSGQKIATLTGHSQRVMALAFSPNGERLASASHDKTVKLWDARSYQRALTLRGHSYINDSVSFDPHSTRLASAGFDHTIRLWNPITGEQIQQLKGHESRVRSVAFSPDGTRLASGSSDKTVRLWDSQSGQQTKILTGHTGEIFSVQFSPDGSRLISGGADKTLILWDVKSGTALKTFTGHTSGIFCVAFSPDDSRVASAGNDRTVRLWDTNSGAELYTLRGHQHIVRCVAFSPDGTTLASASADHSIKLWDVHTGRETKSLKGHVTSVTWLAFSPEGNRLASTSWDRTLKLWNPRTGQEVATIEKSHVGLVSVAFAPDGAQVATTCSNNRIYLWTARPDQEVTTLTGHTLPIQQVTFSQDGKRVYSEAANEKFVWDAVTGSRMNHANWDPPEEVRRVSPDGRWFVTSEAHHLQLVDRHFRNRPHEKAYRESKARFDPEWHQKQAATLTALKNWYPALTHFSWLVQHDPENEAFQAGLHNSFQELKSELAQQNRDLPHLPQVVQESLTPIEAWTNASFEVPRIRARSWAFQEALPRWKTTSEKFEIWSSGFQGITAHEGDQFVELNAKAVGTLYQDRSGIAAEAEIEFSFAHRGRNGEDTLRLTITDLGADNVLGGGDDQELFAKEYTTGTSDWTVYDSATEPAIKARGNRVRFAYTAVTATAGTGPDNTEGNFLDAAHFGVGVVTSKR